MKVIQVNKAINMFVVKLQILNQLVFFVLGKPDVRQRFLCRQSSEKRSQTNLQASSHSKPERRKPSHRNLQPRDFHHQNLPP
jgi:hypothetical protein